MRRTRVACFLGDAAGIGPELLAGIAARGDLAGELELLLVGDARVFRRGAAQAGVPARVRLIRDPAAAWEGDGAALLDLGGLDPATAPPGQVSAASGRAALRGLAAAMELARREAVDAVAYAPLNKQALHAGGSPFPDELHYCASLLGVPSGFGEINVLEGLWTARVTSHVPLRDVASLLFPAAILESLRRLDGAMRRAGLSPRLAVAALNPHAGEGGLFGDEEGRIIAPAVAAARAAGLDAAGPLPADTVFVRARRGEFNGVLCMYHDQGQIATKLLGFERGVTLGAGLPVPLVTPAHGTAFDIAGAGRADPGAMLAALRLAARLGRPPVPAPDPGAGCQGEEK